VRNPKTTPWAVLGVPKATWDAAIAQLTTWLENHADREEIPDAEIRALHPALADDRVWAEVKKAIGG
jgi:hypothetical protein